MGTRHLIAVQIDNEYKVAQYGQWDGYPSSQGVGILQFLRKANLTKFAEKVRACKFLTPDEIKARWTECGADFSKNPDGFVSMQISERFANTYPQLSRDTGSDILGLIQNSKAGLELKNSIGFAADSLFCEYAYVVDLDKGTFEVFKGFNQTPLKRGERFSELPVEEKKSGDTYYPVKKVCEFSLLELPTQKEFLKRAEPQEEEESA